jgi:hypothetical protein
VTDDIASKLPTNFPIGSILVTGGRREIMTITEKYRKFVKFRFITATENKFVFFLIYKRFIKTLLKVGNKILNAFWI